MAVVVRAAEARGHADHGWLDTNHTFSFAGYRDPDWMGFRSLRVMNEDRIAPGSGFPPHDHHDMEIVTLVLAGALRHEDSLGSGEVLHPGEVQVMTAGTGITHSEFNPSESEPGHFYQLWLFPREKGLKPSYQQAEFSPELQAGRFQPVVSADGIDGSLVIQQDATIYLGEAAAGETLNHPLAAGRHAWVQVLAGSGTVNGLSLNTSDGAAISDEEVVTITAGQPDFRVMLLDLA